MGEPEKKILSVRDRIARLSQAFENDQQISDPGPKPVPKKLNTVNKIVLNVNFNKVVEGKVVKGQPSVESVYDNKARNSALFSKGHLLQGSDQQVNDVRENPFPPNVKLKPKLDLSKNESSQKPKLAESASTSTDDLPTNAKDSETETSRSHTISTQTTPTEDHRVLSFQKVEKLNGSSGKSSKYQQLRNNIQRQHDRSSNLISSKNFKSNPNLSQQEETSAPCNIQFPRSSGVFKLDNNRQFSRKTNKETNMKESQHSKKIFNRVPNKQEQLIPDFNIFQAVDHHAKMTPSHAEINLRSLVQYLTSECHNQLEGVRSFFMWIAYNIKYDFKMAQVRMSPDEIIQKKVAVCQNYSDLFQAMCSEIQLEVVQIRGFAKGKGFQIGHNFNSSEAKNHAWNAVKIQGEWRLIDCTWGTGHVTAQGVFQRRLDNHYFMTDPEEMIWSHFPLDENDSNHSRWQLLPKTVTLEEFNSLPKIWSYFFFYGLNISTGRENPVRFEERLEWVVQADKTTRYLYHLTRPGFENDRYLDKFVFHYMEYDNDGTGVFVVTPPSAGQYHLDLYVRNDKDEGSLFNKALTLSLDCMRAASSVPHYPSANNWGPTQEFFKFSMRLIDYELPILKSGDKVDVEFQGKLSTVIKIQNVREDVIQDANFFHESKSENRWTITVAPTRQGYFKMSLYGRPDTPERSKELLPHLGDFLIDNKM